MKPGAKRQKATDSSTALTEDEGVTPHMKQNTANDNSGTAVAGCTSLDEKTNDSCAVKHSSDCTHVIKTKKVRTSAIYVLEASFENDDDDDNESNVEMYEEYETCKEAAEAAWELNEQYELQMPSSEWSVETRYGPQECYNVMVPAGRDWEPKEAFIKYLCDHARKGKVELSGNDGNSISITKK